MFAYFSVGRGKFIWNDNTVREVVGRGFALFRLKPCRFDLNSGKFSKVVLLRGDGVVNYRKIHTVSRLTKITMFGFEQKYIDGR
jgi:hypothetical protein